MKTVRYILSFVFAVCLMLTVLFTAMELAIFNMDFIDSEMEKLEIAEYVSMEPEDLHALMSETMDYLSGDREDLVIDTVVDGEEREAYNDVEKLHMVDVRGLFDAGFLIRNLSAVIGTCLLLILIVCAFIRHTGKETLTGVLICLMLVSLLVLILFAVCAVYMAVDFSSAFTLFHQLLFNNDYWLLDPTTSLMINMLPEQFFYDMAFRIAAFMGTGFTVTALGSLIWFLVLRLRNKKTEGSRGRHTS